MLDRPNSEETFNEAKNEVDIMRWTKICVFRVLIVA